MTVSFDDALRRIMQSCAPVAETEMVELAHADGRFLVGPITAPIALPPTDNSAVDGYAFRHGDAVMGGGRQLAVMGVSAAGRPFNGPLQTDQAVRIFTGAPPPAGADTIAMQEDCTLSGDRIAIPAGIAQGANLRRSGEDVAAGSTLFAAGLRLGPPEIGLLAALGIASVLVRRRLRVAVVSVGDELTQPGHPLGPGGIFDANRPALLSLLNRLGMEATDVGILSDRLSDIRAALGGLSKNHDAILTSAGVSVGDEDHIRAVVEALGSIDIAGVAMKPGKPLAIGRIDGVPFFGMPGNPVAMIVSFLLLVRPGLIALAGGQVAVPWRIPVQADFRLSSKAGRRELLRGCLRNENGRLSVRPYPRGGSAILSSLTDSDGLIELDETVTQVTEGQTLPFIPFSEFGFGH